MNPVRLRQIIETRRSMRTPPLIPHSAPRRNSSEPTLRKGDKKIVDVHVHLKKFRIQKRCEKTPLACVFSESQDGSRDGPWKVFNASEISFCKSAHATTVPISAAGGSDDGFTCSAAFVYLPGVFAVEFRLERCQLIKIDICELLMTGCVSLGYALFSVSELVVRETGSICRSLINDEIGQTIAEATISCTLRPRPHSILMQFAAKNLIKKNLLAVNSTQIFFEIHRVESTTSSPFANLLASANPSYNNFQHFTQRDSVEMTASATSTALFYGPQSNGCAPSGNAIGALLAPTRTTTLLYRSEHAKYSSSRIVWRAFTLQSNEVSGRVLEIVCMYRDAKTSKGSLGRFLTNCDQLRRDPSPDNIYFLIYENSRGLQKTCGMFELLRVTQIALPSFLEYVSTGCTLNFACAIDFSRAATLAAAGEAAVRRYVENVEMVLRAVGEPLRHFNAGSNFLAFGFGAKIPPQFRESQEFCLNMETDPYCRGLDGVQRAFRSAFAAVRPLNVAHLSHVIYYVAKLAQSAVNRVQASNASTTAAPAAGSGFGDQHPAYFVLLVITRGVFDDLSETVQSIIFASRAPISVVFVALDDEIDTSPTSIIAEENSTTEHYNFESLAHSDATAAGANCASDSAPRRQPTVNGVGELARLAQAGTRLNYHGRRADCDSTQYVSLADCRREESSPDELRALIAERALLNVPWQMTAWLTKYGFRANSAIIADPILDVGVANEAIGEQAGASPSCYTLGDPYGELNGDLDGRKTSSVRRKSRLLAANVGAQLRQLAARRCRGGIWCRHAAPSSGAIFDSDDDLDGLEGS